MYFIRAHKPEKVDWKISEQTRTIVEEFAEYAKLEEHHVVDIFLKNLLADPSFAKYLHSKRNSKRLVEKIFFGDKSMGLLDTCQTSNKLGFDLYRPNYGDVSSLGSDVEPSPDGDDKETEGK